MATDLCLNLPPVKLHQHILFNITESQYDGRKLYSAFYVQYLSST